MENYKILDHPADIGIEIHGKSIEELFINATLGTSSLISDLEALEETIRREIKLKAKDFEELFTKWLDEVIYLFDSEGLLIKNVEILNQQMWSLQAIVRGEKYSKNKHRIKLYLKAVTYHQLEIKKLDDGSFFAKVFFDV